MGRKKREKEVERERERLYELCWGKSSSSVVPVGEVRFSTVMLQCGVAL